MIRRSSDALPAMVAAITTATAGPVTASAGSATRTARNAVARVGSIPRMTTTITLRIMEAKMADAIVVIYVMIAMAVGALWPFWLMLWVLS